jgi:flagellar L-ring protein FlgH
MLKTWHKVVLIGSTAVLGAFQTGCGPKSAKTSAIPALQAFVAEAKTQPAAPVAAEGSLYVPNTRRADLFRDFRARNINDVVTIKVSESTQASASADATTAKKSEISTGIDSLVGLQGKVKELPSLVSGKSDATFAGSGSTTRASSLQTSLTARVIDVLPNGYLMVEAVREIRLNNETQNLYLTGIVRPEDITRNNVVASSSVAQMTVRVQGRGIVSEPIRPGWLFKILNGILPF